MIEADVRPLSVQHVPATTPPGRDSPSEELTVALGGEARLLGYDLESRVLRPGEHLRLTLYWQATQRMTRSYSVFVHMARADEKIVLQADRVPEDGALPTNSSMPSEVVTDRYDLVIPDEQAGGEYRLLVGMYDPTTLRRLTGEDPAMAADGNRVPLGTLWILGEG